MTISSFLKQHLILPLLTIGILLVLFVIPATHSKEYDNLPASLVGVHHLGPDYLIHKFYINKSISDNISEGGGGGSMVCCISLPRKWRSTLVVDVRWEVHHIIRSTVPTVSETAELEGIYHAQVPVEQYTESGDFYIHFFPNGRVRVVVSPITSDGEQHPIRSGDAHASESATKGIAAKALFNVAETAERERKPNGTRKEYGGWR